MKVEFEAPRVPAPEAPGITSGQIFGAALAVVGVGWLLDALGVVGLSWQGLLSIALIVVGVGIVAGSRKRHSGLIALSIVIALTLAISASLRGIEFSAQALSLAGGIGQVQIEPQSLAELEPDYSLGVGELQMDFGQLELPEGTTRVRIEVGMGELIVRVPAGLAVDVESRVGAGEVEIFGEKRVAGTGLKDVFETPGSDSATRRLSLDIAMGFGRVEVTSAGP